MKDIKPSIIPNEQLLERSLAKLIKDNTGKGPKHTEVKMAEGIIVCYFDGYLNRAEELIIKSGHPEKIIEFRSRYVTQCISEIETILVAIVKKKIKYFFPSWIPESDLACWTIFLD